MTDTQQKIILMCCFGEIIHHYSCKYFIEKLLSYPESSDINIRIVVGTDKPELFSDPNLNTLNLTDDLIAEWSLAGSYYFAVKNRFLRSVSDLYPHNEWFYFDNDLIPTRALLTKYISGSMKEKELGMFRRERLIFGPKKQSSVEYAQKLVNQKYSLPSGKIYQLETDAYMWGSAAMSGSELNRMVLDDAYFLIKEWMGVIESHTIEQFAMSESAKVHGYNITPIQKYLKHYSTSGRKLFAQNRLRRYYETRTGINATKLPRIERNVFEKMLGCK